VHIAHNVIIGQDCAIAGCTGIAGSTTLGKRCLIGGGVGILGHLKICDDTTINATTTVYKSITSPKTYTGIMPIMIHKQWQNVSLWLIKLDKIANYLNIKLKNLKGK
jgi:UDP-3-O-[3-hydroxymyristoyl] glucosamine N-acyltransferase